jgi:hypothetical protein
MRYDKRKDPGYEVANSTIFHPANRPINFLKLFFLDFFINSVRVRVRVRVAVRVRV